jgi:hypothetical protein
MFTLKGCDRPLNICGPILVTCMEATAVTAHAVYLLVFCDTTERRLDEAV